MARPSQQVEGERLVHGALAVRADPMVAAGLGWIHCAAVTGLGLQRADPVWAGQGSLAHLVVALGHLLGAGAVVVALTWLRVGCGWRGRWSRRLSVASLGAGLAWLAVSPDLANVAARLAGSVPPAVTTAGAAIGLGVLLATTVELGRRLRGRAGRSIVLGAAAIAVIMEPHVLAGLYPGLHLFFVVTTASWVGAALVGVGLPRVLGPRPRWPVLLLLASGLLAYVVPVSEAVHFLVVRDGDVVAQIVGRYLPRDVAVSATPGRDSEWLRPRADLPPIGPTPGARFHPNPIVVLLTVDCLRYDVVAGSDAARAMPNLARARARGASFARAQTPGSGTVYTLTSLFSGKYYSQLEWSRERRGIWPSRDPTPRYPELLSDAGVWTVHAASFDWLNETSGVVRGFEVEDYRELPGPRWKPAASLAAALVARLGEVGERPAFLYAHFNDAHLPYDRGGTQGSPYERYLRELRIVDAQIGEVLQAIDRLELGARVLWIVTSDHGEAFGEHGRRAHASSVYQELNHVPLVIGGPGIAPAVYSERVSLIDLGPTILDVFGLPTPAQFMGESLYPALAGERFAPTRPILAQSGPLRSLVTAGGVKVIRDTRRGTVEAYDLEADPGELANVIGAGRRDVDEALRTLDAFFEVHRFRRAGYVEPVR